MSIVMSTKDKGVADRHCHCHVNDGDIVVTSRWTRGADSHCHHINTINVVVVLLFLLSSLSHQGQGGRGVDGAVVMSMWMR